MPRFALNLGVSKAPDQGICGEAIDFSRSGMRVVLDEPAFDNKPELQVFINRPDYNQEVLVDASVAWVKQSAGKYEIGLKFKAIPPGAKADFLDYGYKMWLKKVLPRQ